MQTKGVKGGRSKKPIENVPCLKCDQCGEVVYSASVMEKIDDILEKVQNIASKIFIMDYTKAA